MHQRALEMAGLSPSITTPRHMLAFFLASCSILSLLLYFSGWSMTWATRLILLPSALLLVFIAVRASHRGDQALVTRLMTGLWAGSFATLAYDVVRVPLAHAGIPVFKAISYFGTLILEVPRPTLASEIAGWTYHFSNGVGFAIMYTLLVRRPGWLSAVVWGITLEGAMLVTPYAEVFGYRRSASFLAISVGAHVFYGLGLWLAARYYTRRTDLARGTVRDAGRWFLLAAWLSGPAGLVLMAADFHKLHASTIAPSPPSYIGSDLYVTWNVPEPDRVGAIWLMTRFINPQARFHFVEPMSRVAYGTPFDLPEAEIRRDHNRSTFEVVLERSGRQDEPAMASLARLCYLTEIRPWALASAPREKGLADSLVSRLGDCRNLEACLPAGLAWFDETYARLSATAAPLTPGHAWIVVTTGAPERAKLEEAGFRMAPTTNRHDGQGTASVTVELLDGFLELIYPDPTVPVSPALQAGAEKFRLRSGWRENGYCPIGIVFDRTPATPGTFPFATWRISAAWMEPGTFIEMLTPKEMPKAVSLSISSHAVSARESNEALAREPARHEMFQHPNGARRLTGLRVVSPTEDPLPPAASYLAGHGLVEFERGSEWLLDVTLDGGAQGKTADLRPDLPMVIHY